MWPLILAFIAFIVFAIIMAKLFFIPVVVVGANLVILYFLFLRIYTEITKYKRGDIYAYSTIAAILLLLIFRNFLPLWWITTMTFLSFVITHIYILFQKSQS